MTTEKAENRRNIINKDYLSVETSKCVKGILTLMILVSHARGKMPEMNETIPGQILTSLGYLAVAMFMFYTGYGLRYSAIAKGKVYIRSMPWKRIIPFYVHCLIMVAIYAVFNYFFLQESFDMPRLLQSITLGNTVVEYGWYLHALLLIYVLFYAINMIAEKSAFGIAAHLMLIAIYVIICVLLKSNTIYYEFLLAYFLTKIWYDQKEKIDSFCAEKWILCIAGTGFLFAITLFVGNVMTSWIALAFGIKMLSAMLFCTLVLIILMKIRLPGKILAWLGDRSFEIYVSQGLFFKLFRSENLYIRNPGLFVLVCTGATILTATFLYVLFRKLDLTIQKKKIR